MTPAYWSYVLFYLAEITLIFIMLTKVMEFCALTLRYRPAFWFSSELKYPILVFDNIRTCDYLIIDNFRRSFLMLNYIFDRSKTSRIMIKFWFVC